MIQVPNQLVGNPLGTTARLECVVEASPKSINYWTKDNVMISGSSKIKMEERRESHYITYMSLRILKLSKIDYGRYNCYAKNSYGEAVEKISLNGESELYPKGLGRAVISLFFCQKHSLIFNR